MSAIVTDRHIRIGLECTKQWIDGHEDLSEVVTKIVAREFPDFQPMTELPTEPGHYWFRWNDTDSWDYALVYGPEDDLHVDRIGFQTCQISHFTGGQWLRILPPASPAKKWNEA